MDVLDDILDTLDLQGVLYFRTDFSGSWAVTVPQIPYAARFHLVMQGSCHVEIEGAGTVMLETGDMVMIPQGRSHVLADRPGRNARPLETVLDDAGYDGRGALSMGGSGSDASTQMVCGHYSFRNLAAHPILAALPDRIVITAAERLRQPWLDDLLRMMAQRVFGENLGSDVAVRRLSEVVFAEVIRTGIARDDALAAILSGFRDPQIGRSLELMHEAPEKSWTVAALATEVGMSRSAFAEHFRTAMGLSPMAYFSDWRMQKALSLLADPRMSVQRVAGEIGYLSPAAFSRAFSGKFGMAPAAYRRDPA